MSKELLFLFNEKKIKIITTKKLNLQTRLIFAIKEYPMNPILIIGSNLLFPEGWLEMLINDHKLHPDEIISSSIQYYFGKNAIINEFSEGYKGYLFGTFNHISNMIFNFAIINTELGGTLYPPGIFKNKYFFDEKLFSQISNESDEFWQSCFIIIENKILRQSSKIYDYTKYLINNKTIVNKKHILERIKKKFFKFFPNFYNIIEFRQKKIIVSLTSYYKRFGYLENVLKSIKKQILLPYKILLVLYEEDFKKYKLNLNGVEIIKVNKDIKPHKKYYYSMIKYRDYAIITLDDDIYYSSDTILSLYESYINHPNVISGRRTHLIKYKSSLQIEKYTKWLFEQNLTKNSSYDLFITTGAGALYPPDILNIEEKYMNLINEIITTDDIALKYYEIKKGIESIWVPNNFMLGYKIKTNSSKEKDTPLYFSNILINDININKLNIDINNIIITNYCIQYKNIKTGLLIYLFNINNIKFDKENKTNFEIDAYSFCPIDEKIKFKILFNESVIANCNFINNFSLISKNLKILKTKAILRATCSIKKKINKLNDFFFPIAQSNNELYINILNKRNYISLIFKDFYCINSLKCTMIALSYKNLKKGYKIIIHIYNKDYICKLRNKINYLNNNIPIISYFSCIKTFNNNNLSNDDYIGGIKFASYIKSINLNNYIPNQFIINKIYIEKLQNISLILIKGHLLDNLKRDINNLTIFVTYPEFNLECSLNNSSKYIQSNIYCYTNNKFTGEILIENQIIYNKDFSENLIIISELTLIQNYEILNYVKIKDCTFLEILIKIINNLNQKIYYIILFLLLLLKLHKKKGFEN